MYGETIEWSSPLGHKRVVVVTDELRKRFKIPEKMRIEKEIENEYFNENLSSRSDRDQSLEKVGELETITENQPATTRATKPMFKV